MANEKKGKGLFGKIASAITGNESDKAEEKNDISNLPPTGNGADNDAVSDQSTKDELSAEPKKTTGSKSYSDMLRERTAQRQESMKRFSPQEIDKIKSDKANGDQIVQK